MTIYQKAIKVKKECETHRECENCPYKKYCLISDILFFEPSMENIEDVAKAILKEKWNVK